MSADDVAAALGRIRTSVTLDALANCDLVEQVDRRWSKLKDRLFPAGRP